MEKLTKAEKLALETIAAECHEELVKGTPPAVISPICNECKKRVHAKCSEHPKGIPTAILANEENCPMFEQK